MSGTFHFKRFSIKQSSDVGVKVGTDGVLLGAWCAVAPWQRRLLDVGTGTGVIALMLAQRTACEGSADALIEALDIDHRCCRQAFDNVAASPWAERVSVVEKSLQDFARPLRAYRSAGMLPALGAMGLWAHRPGLYDHIVSNPPYFTSSLLPPGEARKTARHAILLPHGELLEASARLLTQQGILSLVLPCPEADQVEAAAPDCGLYLTRATDVSTKEGAQPKRRLIEFARICPQAATRSHLAICRSQGDDFTDQYRNLTREFYLKF